MPISRQEHRYKKKWQISVNAVLHLACVASVDVGFSTVLKHFSLFFARKKKPEGEFPLISRLHSPSPLLPFFCARPNFRAAKKRKMPRTDETSAETLATQAILKSYQFKEITVTRTRSRGRVQILSCQSLLLLYRATQYS